MASRREFLGGVLTAAPEARPIPHEVAGVELPDGKLARVATDFTRGLSAPVVFNHVLRTYLFGELTELIRRWDKRYGRPPRKRRRGH
jgi:hypothetical protein